MNMTKLKFILFILSFILYYGFSYAILLKTSKVKTRGKYKITLINEFEGIEYFILCYPDELILECGEEANIDLPYRSRSGSDNGSLGKIVKGIVDQSRQSFLNDDQIESGYVLLDVAYPRSDLIIEYGLSEI